VAQVKAVPKPLVINGHVVCKAEGNSTDDNLIALDSSKNRVDIPDTYIPIDWDTLSTLPTDSPDDIVGAPIMVEGYLGHIIRVQTSGKGESTNCNLHEGNEVDWHIYLAKNAHDADIANAIVVETTPRVRPLLHWNNAFLAKLRQVVDSDTKVRISGWLMFDSQHTGVVGSERVSAWEVHPITRIEIKTNGGWQDLQ
jgi:hypothetical protein